MNSKKRTVRCLTQSDGVPRITAETELRRVHLKGDLGRVDTKPNTRLFG